MQVGTCALRFISIIDHVYKLHIIAHTTGYCINTITKYVIKICGKLNLLILWLD